MKVLLAGLAVLALAAPAGAATVAAAIRISNAKIIEGDSGWKRMKFVVRLTRVSNLTFLPGQTTKTVYVRVNGDFRNEPNETFKIRRQRHLRRPDRRRDDRR